MGNTFYLEIFLKSELIFVLGPGDDILYRKIKKKGIELVMMTLCIFTLRKPRTQIELFKVKFPEQLLCNGIH
jgi:hypothetical protein